MIKENQLRVTEIKEEVSNIRGLINRFKRHDTIIVSRKEGAIYSSKRSSTAADKLHLLEATGALYTNIQE